MLLTTATLLIKNLRNTVQGASIKETGPTAGADSIAGVLEFLRKNFGVNILMFFRKNYFSVKVLTYWAPS
jgi:hypothetical protein